jgi:hypothetical protein
MNIKLRDCTICGEPVMMKQYQANSARACSPVCARILACRENPDLEGRRVDGGSRNGEIPS